MCTYVYICVDICKHIYTCVKCHTPTTSYTLVCVCIYIFPLSF